MHTFPDGTSSWKFDGFLMMDYMMYNPSGLVVGLGESNYTPSQRSDWEDLIEVQLGTKTGFGCRALDELIGEMLPVLGTPSHKHKVVINMPVPDNVSQVWGKIDDTALNMSLAAHKTMAMKWYVDLIVERWNDCGFKNIELDGIYWTKESFYGDSWTPIITDVNKHIHSKNLKAYWIPYLKAYGKEHWTEWGMDVCYVQPNYYFKLETPISQLSEAIDYAWASEMGMEMEFEGLNYGYIPSTDNVYTAMAPNSGLYSYHPEFYQKLVDYIDYFENEFVFDCMPVAYYNGRQAVYDFCTSNHPKDRGIMDRLATIINKRHTASGWSVSGIDDPIISQNLNAHSVKGGIYIADETGDEVNIFATDGSLVYSRASSTDGRLQYGTTVSCTPGIYIVRCGDKSVKVCVTN